MRVAEFLLPSLAAGLKYRRSWRGSEKGQPLDECGPLTILKRKHVCFHTDKDVRLQTSAPATSLTTSSSGIKADL